MQSDIVKVSDLTDSDLDAWRELAGASVEPNPFVEPDFVLPAMRAWDVNDVAVLRVRNGATWLAAIPVQSVASWRSVPGRCLVAWRHPYCYLSNPLVARGDVEGIVSALLARGHRDASGFGLEWIASDGPFAEVLGLQCRVAKISEFERAALYRGHAHVGDNPPTGHTARNLRRQRRLLERDSGELAIRDRSGDRTAHERFLDIESVGWKGSETHTAMACRPGHGEFFLDMCARFASLGRLRLLALESDGQIIAVKSDLVAGSTLYGFKSAFDERYARYSPGAQLEMASMEAFWSEGWEMFDACTAPDNTFYNKLWPTRRTLHTVIVTPRDTAGTLGYAKWRAASAMRPVGRRLRELPARGLSPTRS